MRSGRHVKKNKKITIFFFVFFAFNFLCFSSNAQTDKDLPYDFSGYFKSFNTLIQNPSFDGSPSPLKKAEFVSLNTVRLEFKWNPSSKTALHLAYALLPTFGTKTENGLDAVIPRPDPFKYRFADIRTRIYPGSGESPDKIILINNIDRASLSYYTPMGDFIIGRQPISFGSSRFLSPTDILSPFTFEELDKEERVGIDAIRYRVPVGTMGEFDTAWVFGEDAKISNSGAFSKLKFCKLETDITLLAMIFRNNFLLGFDIARSVGGASVWIEGAYTFASLLNDYISDENYFRVSLGMDYNFEDNLYAFMEYHYNGAGKIDPRDYPDLLNETAYTEGSVYLLGMHYLTVGSNYEITPIWHLNTNLVLNVNDPSTFLIFTLEYNVAQDIYIDLGTYLTIGSISSLTGNSSDPITVDSEFGLSGNMYYSAGRFYF